MRWGAERRTRAGGVGEADRPAVTWAAGLVDLRDRALFPDPAAAACRLFLQRVFRLDEVSAVELDRRRGTARVRFEHGKHAPQRALERIAAAVAGAHDGCPTPAIGALPPDDEPWTVLRFVRYDDRVTTWDVVHESPGRVRLRNDALCTDEPLVHRVARELPAVEGVATCQIRRLTGSLLVRFDPAAMDTRKLLRILDHLLGGSAHALGYTGDPIPVPFALANTSVGLAAVGELAVPALLPVSALLLVGSNVTTLHAAWDELRQRRPGLPTLYAAIIAATLASGQFLTAAVMAWMVKFWHRQHRERLLATRRRLLRGLAQHPRWARRLTAEAEDVLLEDLAPGDAVVVAAGAGVPADGRVVDGWALVDEHLLRGAGGLVPKGPGAAVFAGSWVREGEIRVVVERVGSATRATRLARTLYGAAVPSASRSAVTAHGQTFAERTVVPTLATAGLGLLVGDLTTAAAVLRPDYATGPGLGVALELLEDTAECARRGVIVRDPTALRRLAEARMILFDDQPALWRSPLAVAAVRVDDPHGADRVLRVAAAALTRLADERAIALAAACQARGLGALDAPPGYCDGGFVVRFEAREFIVASASDDHAASLLVHEGERLVGMIDFHPAPAPAACAAVEALRTDPALALGLLSQRAEAEAGRLGQRLGVHRVHAGLSRAAKVELLRAFRRRGINVALVGDWRDDPGIVKEAHVAVSIARDAEPDVGPAPILLLGGDVGRLAWLRDFARGHVSRVRAVHGATLVPNLLCVAGAFLFGFTSMSSVIITNLGTWGVYARLPQRVGRGSGPRRVAVSSNMMVRGDDAP